MTSLRNRLGRLRSLATDARVRSDWLTRLGNQGTIHQETSYTALDRYPRLFTLVQGALGGEGEHRILSFGCSSGEEVLTLRSYFPNAWIIGAELNRACLAQCRALPAHSRTAFIESRRDRITAAGPFDAIFCMAVLQRRPHQVERDGITDLSPIYPFDRFADEVAFLVGCLRKGSLLIVEHSHYRVEDCPSVALLEPLATEAPEPAAGIRFDPNGKMLAAGQPINRIFRRRD